MLAVRVCTHIVSIFVVAKNKNTRKTHTYTVHTGQKPLKMFTCNGYKRIAFYKMVLRFSSSVSLRLTVCMAMCLCATASGHMDGILFYMNLKWSVDTYNVFVVVVSAFPRLEMEICIQKCNAWNATKGDVRSYVIRETITFVMKCIRKHLHGSDEKRIMR